MKKFFKKTVDKRLAFMYNKPRRRESGAGNLRGVAQSGSARALGAWGRGFESLHPDQKCYYR